MKESLELLEKAEANYKLAISDIGVVNAKLRDFNSAIQKMILTDSAEHTAWVTKFRNNGYAVGGSAVAGASVGLIVVDIFGCLGICTAVGNLIGWGATVAITEGSIAV